MGNDLSCLASFFLLANDSLILLRADIVCLSSAPSPLVYGRRIAKLGGVMGAKSLPFAPLVTPARLRPQLLTVPRPHVRGTGLTDIDALLPFGGFPCGAITELASIGGLAPATSLALAVVAATQNQKKSGEPSVPWCSFLDPTASLYGPGVAARGVVLERFLVIRPAADDLARAAVHVVSSRAFAVVIVDTVGVPGTLELPSTAGWATARRRVALAAEGTDTVVLFLTNAPMTYSLGSWAALRVELRQPSAERLALRVTEMGKPRRSLERHVSWLPVAGK